MAIPIHFEKDDNARLHTDGESFTIEAHLDKVGNPKYWVDDVSYGMCHSRDNLSLEELMKLLRAISDYLKVDMIIEEQSEKMVLPKRHIIDDDTIYYHSYRIIVNNKVVFDKDTLRDGSVTILREQVVKWVARLVYDYELFMDFFKR